MNVSFAEPKIKLADLAATGNFSLDSFFRQAANRMARIPEAEIERLKREIALERLVEARGVVLKRKGLETVCRRRHSDAI